MTSPIVVILIVLLPILFIAAGYFFDYRQDKVRFVKTVKGVAITIGGLALSYIFIDDVLEKLLLLLSRVW